MKRLHVTILLLCALLVLLPACRRRAEVLATAIPTLTATPRSTPLPPVATLVPAGAAGNPIQVIIVSSAVDSASAQAELDVALKVATSLDLQLTLVSASSDALAALCQSAGGSAAVTWLDGGAYLAAVARRCGEAALILERDGQRGDAPVLVANSKSKISQVGDVTDKTLCQLDIPEFFSWLAPTLIGQVEGVDVLSAIKRTQTYPDRVTMLKALADGDCDMAGIPESALNATAADLGDKAQNISIVARMPPLPFAAFMLPNAVSLTAQQALIAAMSDKANAATLRTLLGAGQVVEADAESLATLQNFISTTGLDFSALGQ